MQRDPQSPLSFATSPDTRNFIKKKKSNGQRQAKLFNVPDDILSKVMQKKESQQTQPHSPLYVPSSLPTHQRPNFPQQFIPPPQRPQQATVFINYSEYCQPQPPQSVIINSFTRDINDVLFEIVVSRPPAPYIESETPPSTICPFSMVPITCPGRGFDCNHADCFDLREFILLQMDDNWKCPICGNQLTFESLRFDASFFRPKPKRNMMAGPDEGQDGLIMRSTSNSWMDFHNQDSFDYGELG